MYSVIFNVVMMIYCIIEIIVRLFEFFNCNKTFCIIRKKKIMFSKFNYLNCYTYKCTFGVLTRRKLRYNALCSKIFIKSTSRNYFEI